jgi:hypothetical protein
VAHPEVCATDIHHAQARARVVAAHPRVPVDALAPVLAPTACICVGVEPSVLTVGSAVGVLRRGTQRGGAAATDSRVSSISMPLGG